MFSAARGKFLENPANGEVLFTTEVDTEVQFRCVMVGRSTTSLRTCGSEVVWSCRETRVLSFTDCGNTETYILLPSAAYSPSKSLDLAHKRLWNLLLLNQLNLGDSSFFPSLAP